MINLFLISLDERVQCEQAFPAGYEQYPAELEALGAQPPQELKSAGVL